MTLLRSKGLGGGQDPEENGSLVKRLWDPDVPRQHRTGNGSENKGSLIVHLRVTRPGLDLDASLSSLSLYIAQVLQRRNALGLHFLFHWGFLFVGGILCLHHDHDSNTSRRGNVASSH